MSDFERVGIILVHGIGEQRRLEHLDAQARAILRAIELTGQAGGPDLGVTVELRDAGSTEFLSEQNTWRLSGSGAAARAVVRDAAGSFERQLFFHEVWWADANEPYSLSKQVRFWWWATTVWNLRSKDQSTLSGFQREMDNPPPLPAWRRFGVRLQILCASYIFALAIFSVGALVFIAKRLLDIDAPSPVRTFVNYLSALKLYNQPTRAGGGFLDARSEPPRVSVRRRMMRVLSDVALAGYDRWYIVAHSLGTVVAYNGLMETGHAFPNYLDQAGWRLLANYGMAGAARGDDEVGPTNDMIPVRPLWLEPEDVVYREKLFENFRGLITFGSPLNKFVTLWPARVPRNRAAVISNRAKWINFYDRIDPVSGVLRHWLRWVCGAPSFREFATFEFTSDGTVNTIMPPLNIGYRSSWIFLLSHIRYLAFDEKSGDRGVAGRIADIVVGAPQGLPLPRASRRFYYPGGVTDRVRQILVVVQWLILFVAVTLLSGLLTWYGVPSIFAGAKEAVLNLIKWFG